jgi:hypothetical protein
LKWEANGWKKHQKKDGNRGSNAVGFLGCPVNLLACRKQVPEGNHPDRLQFLDQKNEQVGGL